MAFQSNKAGPSRLPSSRNHSLFEYDVFLSFRGEDTRNNFTGLFHYILELQGIHSFFDEEDLHKGERIEWILDAIRKSKISVPIFSQRYAESKWCLREVVKMVDCDDGGQERLIVPIFFDVDPTDVRHQTGPFEAAFKKHQKEKRDEVDGWRRALGYIGGISGYHFKDYNGNQRQLAVSIIDGIQKVLTTKRLLYEEEYLVGLDVRAKEMIKHLDFQAKSVRIIGIHGIGGIGKTTLAKAIYNRSRHLFKASCFIENVREVSKLSKGLVHLQRQFIQDISKDKHKKEIHNLSQGAKMIEDMVRGKSVLLVLDDVDDQKQLDVLVGKISWFHSGSRVIVTTRQEKILQGLQYEAVYMLEELDEKEALQLFNHHAFGDDAPQQECINLSKEVVSISKLPLVLLVFGSHFKTASTPEEMKNLLKELRRRQLSEVHEKLRICYDSLNDEEKLIFLDIACLLVGKNSEDAIYMWEDLKLSPHLALRSLQNKSLIKINKGKFEMHDQLRDMGREIVFRESSSHPENRSRLWYVGDVMEALTKSQGNMVEGLSLNVHEGNQTKLSTEAFESLSKLRILHVNFAIFGDCDFKHFPANLKWLEWKGCCLKTLPLESKFKSIVVLNLSQSSISQLWSETTTCRSSKSVKELFDGLKVLDLSYCHCLVAAPNFAMAPNLEKLILDQCVSLKEVDDSIGSLKKLFFLSMRECVSLEKLPNKIYELSSLQVFNVEGCRSLVAFPQLEHLKTAAELGPGATPLTFLPTSTCRTMYIYQTTSGGMANATNGLSDPEGLILRGCESLEFLPLLHNFQFLQSLHIDGCLEDVAFREWDIEAVHISGSPTQLQKQEYSFMLPVGSNSDPLHLQQLQCYGYGDPHENGTMKLRVHHEHITNGWVALETIHEAHCDNSIYVDDVYGHCYTINFGSNDEINEAPRGKTIVMKVTTSKNSKLTKVDVKLQKRSKFSGEHMKPVISISRTEAFLSPPASLQLSSSGNSGLEFSIFFSQYEEEGKLDVIEYSTGLDNRIQKMMQLVVECVEPMLLFGWNIEELIILTLIFSDINVSWYETGNGTMSMPRQATTKAFDKIKTLDFSYCNFLVKIPDFSCIPHLEKLVLDECKCLVEIGESIGQLENLTQLSIIGCAKLRELPRGILQLNSLQVLRIEKCPEIVPLPKARMMDVRMGALLELVLDDCTSLTRLPNYVGKFRSLLHLSLRNCCSLKELPTAFGCLVAVRKLILDGDTSLTRLPDFVGHLRSLRSLSLIGCRSLEQLPDSVGRLKALEKLVLDGCTSLTKIPDSVGGLRSLRWLSMRGCSSLKMLPESIGSLVALEELTLDDCTSLTEIPNYDRRLESLRCLSMSGCSSLKKLPETIGSLVVLEELILDDCTSLRRIPDCVGQLTSLRHLSLRSCYSLKQLPNSIGSLEAQRNPMLDAWSSLIGKPDYVKQISDPRRLFLEGFHLPYWQPNSIENLENLQELALETSLLKEIPNYVGRLKSLRRLSLTGCHSANQLPDAIGSLVVLEELILDTFPSLERLPVSISNLKRLTKMRCINCSSLKSMPELSSLMALEELNVAECRSLVSIPGLQKLRSLKVLHMNGCWGLDHHIIQLQLEEAAFNVLEAFSISNERQDPIDSTISVPFPRGGSTSSKPLHVEKINVEGSSDIRINDKRITLKLQVAGEDRVLFVHALSEGQNGYCLDNYTASFRNEDDISKRLRVLLETDRPASSRLTVLQVSRLLPVPLHLERVSIWFHQSPTGGFT